MQTLKQSTLTTIRLVAHDLKAYWGTALVFIAIELFGLTLSSERLLYGVYIVISLAVICHWHQTCINQHSDLSSRTFMGVVGLFFSYLFTGLFLSIGLSIAALAILAPGYLLYHFLGNPYIDIVLSFGFVSAIGTIFLICPWVLSLAISLPDAALGNSGTLSKAKLNHKIYARLHIMMIGFILLILLVGIFVIYDFADAESAFSIFSILANIAFAVFFLITASTLNALYRQYDFQFRVRPAK